VGLHRRVPAWRVSRTTWRARPTTPRPRCSRSFHKANTTFLRHGQVAVAQGGEGHARQTPSISPCNWAEAMRPDHGPGAARRASPRWPRQDGGAEARIVAELNARRDGVDTAGTSGRPGRRVDRAMRPTQPSTPSWDAIADGVHDRGRRPSREITTRSATATSSRCRGDRVGRERSAGVVYTARDARTAACSVVEKGEKTPIGRQGRGYLPRGRRPLGTGTRSLRRTTTASRNGQVSPHCLKGGLKGTIGKAIVGSR